MKHLDWPTYQFAPKTRSLSFVEGGECVYSILYYTSMLIFSGALFLIFRGALAPLVPTPVCIEVLHMCTACHGLQLK